MFEYDHLPEGSKKEARKNMYEKDQILRKYGLSNPESYSYGVMLDFYTEKEYPYSIHRQGIVDFIQKLKQSSAKKEIVEWMEAWLVMEDETWKVG